MPIEEENDDVETTTAVVPTLKIDEPGVYDVPENTYHADRFLPEPSLSSSGARKILPPNGCPARFWYDRENYKPESPVLRFGKAAHAMLLEPETWKEKYEVLPANWNARTNAGKEYRAKIEAAGKLAIKNVEFEVIEGMLKALREHRFAMAAFQQGASEKTLVWKDPEFGIWCRVRPDFFPHNHSIVTDFKTTRSAEPTAISRSMYDYTYHQQAAWYMDGINQLGLIDNPRFLFIFQEKEPPYIITACTPSEIALRFGEIVNRKAKETFARCLDAGKWPGYQDDEILTVDLPYWAEQRLEGLKQEGAFEIMKEANKP